jgi:hypothetical protein
VKTRVGRAAIVNVPIQPRRESRGDVIHEHPNGPVEGWLRLRSPEALVATVAVVGWANSSPANGRAFAAFQLIAYSLP